MLNIVISVSTSQRIRFCVSPKNLAVVRAHETKSGKQKAFLTPHIPVWRWLLD